MSSACLERDGAPLTTLRTLHLLPVVVMVEGVQDELGEMARALGARQLVDRPEKSGSEACISTDDAEQLLEAIRFHARLSDGEEDPQPGERRILAIGASTGGPQAVMQLLASLPPGLGLSVLIVQHMASGLMAGYADWLDRDSPLSVRLARGGERLLPGMALVAPGEHHLSLHKGLALLTSDPPVNSCRPSVDVLFEALAAECGSSVVAVLLTGIGRDGARGMAALKAKGAHTIAQDEESSVVFGMPRAAIELGAADEVLPLDEIAAAVTRQFDIVD
jgi:chemotaxis response regulator CheB